MRRCAARSVCEVVASWMPRIARGRDQDLEDVSKPRRHGILASMNKQPLVSDDLWEAIEPLLPKEPPKPKGGRPRVPARAALAGIVFVFRTGISWQRLPTV